MSLEQFGPLEENRGRAFHVVSEANGFRSREQVTILADEVLKVGTVLGKITASGKYVAWNEDAADGSEDAAAVLYDAVDATGEDKQATVHIRDCELLDAELIFSETADAGELAAAKAQLVDLGIILR